MNHNKVMITNDHTDDALPLLGFQKRTARPTSWTINQVRIKNKILNPNTFHRLM